MKSSRIFRNSVALYGRQVLLLAVGLYSVRVILAELGVEDYGVFNVVAGAVGLCSFVPSALGMTFQRFFSYALGLSGGVDLKRVANVGWTFHLVVALCALVLLETLGFWLCTNYLSVPKYRIREVEVLFHLSAISFVLAVMANYFISVVVSNEDMSTLATTSVVEALLKLGALFILKYVPSDRLILYGGLVLFQAFLSFIALWAICHRKYVLWRPKLGFEARYIQEVSEFAGWTFAGQFTTVVRNQAITLLLNQSFNPSVVAARVIATNISTQVAIFSNSFNTSLSPPIVKAFAAGDTAHLHSLIFGGCKLTFFLMWIFAWPLIIEMQWVMSAWLINPPPSVVLFAQLALVEGLVLSISLPVASAARAPGNMKVYELTLGSMQVAIFAVSWIVLQFSSEPSAVYLVAIAINVLMFGVRLAIVRVLLGISLNRFFQVALVPVLGVVALSCICILPLKLGLLGGEVHGLAMVVISTATTGGIIYFVGLPLHWRQKLSSSISSAIKKSRAVK